MAGRWLMLWRGADPSAESGIRFHTERTETTEKNLVAQLES
jgi:hypothetical protein